MADTYQGLDAKAQKELQKLEDEIKRKLERKREVLESARRKAAREREKKIKKIGELVADLAGISDLNFSESESILSTIFSIPLVKAELEAAIAKIKGSRNTDSTPESEIPADYTSNYLPSAAPPLESPLPPEEIDYTAYSSAASSYSSNESNFQSSSGLSITDVYKNP